MPPDPVRTAPARRPSHTPLPREAARRLATAARRGPAPNPLAGPDPKLHPVATLALAAVAVGGLSWLASNASQRRARERAREQADEVPPLSEDLNEAVPVPALNARAAQRLNHGSTLLAASVLLDSGVEHYRGQYFNRAMYTPVLVASAVLAASLHGAGDAGAGSDRVRHAIQAAAAATGFVGLGFHVYNVGKREGGYSWENLFYAAPIGAPFALTLAGALGVAAEHVRDAEPEAPRLAGAGAGRALAFGTAFALMGTVGEAGLLHFRGAFQNPAMFVPVTLPPAAAAVLVGSALRAPGSDHRPARLAMWATAVMGVVGVAFHAYGVARMMGGWRNWRQNGLDGPPLPAPPSFSGLALAGLAALDILAAEGAKENAA